MSEPLSIRALAARDRVEEEREQRRRESAARAERERAERAQLYYEEKVAPRLHEVLGTDDDEWGIVKHEFDSMTVVHRDEPDLALCVFGPGHVRLAYQGDDGKWHVWNSGPLIRCLADLGDALRQWERRNDGEMVEA